MVLISQAPIQGLLKVQIIYVSFDLPPMKICNGYKSTDGGYSWQKLPFEIPIGVRSLAFQDENTGWQSSGKVIYKTTDGGNTWQKEFEAESNIKKLY